MTTVPTKKRRYAQHDPNGVQLPTHAKKQRLAIPPVVWSLLLGLLPELRPLVYRHATLSSLGRLAQTCWGLHREICMPGTGPAWLPQPWAATIVGWENDVGRRVAWNGTWYDRVHSDRTCAGMLQDLMHEVLRPAGFFAKIPHISDAVDFCRGTRQWDDRAGAATWECVLPIAGARDTGELKVVWRVAEWSVGEATTLYLQWIRDPIDPDTLSQFFNAVEKKGKALMARDQLAKQRRHDTRADARALVQAEKNAARAQELEARNRVRQQLRRMILRLRHGGELEHEEAMHQLPGLYATLHAASRHVRELRQGRRPPRPLPDEDEEVVVEEPPRPFSPSDFFS
jgi:hypothetical protein